ncbi:hypothetical protein C8R47DRAFT_250150 [Mycena vitilis]|nr:hypothetical protein C8R47DRAFT_250150 [Mycena vitilis]
MSLLANINSRDQRLSQDLCSPRPTLHSQQNSRAYDEEEENIPPSNQLQQPTGGQPLRSSILYGNGSASVSVPGTPRAGSSHGRNASLGQGFLTGTGTSFDFGDGSSVLGRRQRHESMTEWSPPTKVRLKTYADEVAREYGVPEDSREDFLKASMLSTHKLMIVTLGAVLGQREDASIETRLAEYLASSEFKENVVSQIRSVMLDPKIPSYKLGFLDRLMRHIRLNPGVYRIPQEFRSMITSKLFYSAVSRAAVGARAEIKRKMMNMWNTKATIYDVVKSLACKSSHEMTDAIWARLAWVQLKLVDYKATSPTPVAGQDGFWDDIDKALAERREKSLAMRVEDRAAYSSYIFEEALKMHIETCPAKRRKSATRLPQWQEDISRAVEEMESYTQDDLADEVPEVDGDDQPDAAPDAPGP